MRRLLILLALGPGAMAAATAADFDCLVEPKQIIDVRAPVEGMIEAIHVDRGDRVKAGQKLVDLNAGVERAALELARFQAQTQGVVMAARSRVEFAKRKVERAEAMIGNVISQADKDEARTGQKVAEADLQKALDEQRIAALEAQRSEQVLRLKTIVSPIDGVVTDRLRHPGEVTEGAQDQKPLLQLAQINPLNIEVVLPASAIGAVHEKDTVEVVLRDHDHTTVHAQVLVVDPVVHSASETFRVRMALPNPDYKIVAGVRCSARFDRAVEDTATK